MSKKVYANPHFKKRVAERVGPEVDADWLYRRIIDSVENSDGFCRFKARLCLGRRLYRFRHYGCEYAVVMNKRGDRAITVYSGDMYVTVRGGKSKRACRSAAT